MEPGMRDKEQEFIAVVPTSTATVPAVRWPAVVGSAILAVEHGPWCPGELWFRAPAYLTPARCRAFSPAFPVTLS